MKLPVNIVIAEPSPIGAIVIRTTFADLPTEKQRCHDQVNAAIERGELTPAGPLVAVYRQLGARGSVEASIGVQVGAPFADMGALRCLHTPAGRAATVHFEGPASGLPAAHTAILEWADEAGAALTGVSWETFGPTGPDGSAPTDVYHLLDIEPSVIDY